MGLKKLVQYATLNRVTFGGFCLIPGGFAGMVLGIASNNILLFTGSSLGLSAGFAGIGLTNFGGDTYNSYEKAKKFVKKHNSLSERLVRKHSHLYCNRQGVYMAAKELDYLDDYKRALEGKHFIIPNF